MEGTSELACAEHDVNISALAHERLRRDRLLWIVELVPSITVTWKVLAQDRGHPQVGAASVENYSGLKLSFSIVIRAYSDAANVLGLHVLQRSRYIYHALIVHTDCHLHLLLFSEFIWSRTPPQGGLVDSLMLLMELDSDSYRVENKEDDKRRPDERPQWWACLKQSHCM
jgi:hypothetical protein